MEEVIYKSSSASLVYRKDKLIIELTWTKGSDSAEYREIFSNLVEFGRRNKVRYFLSDFRQEGHVPIEDLQWLNEEVLMKVDELGIQKVALVYEDTIFSTTYAETIKRKLKTSPVQVQLFADPVSAGAWLTVEE